jgi:hypothetical protein
MLSHIIDLDVIQSIQQDRLKAADHARLLKIVKAQQIAQRSSRSGLGKMAPTIPGLKARLARLSPTVRWFSAQPKPEPNQN